LAEAEAVLQAVLAVEPQSADALHLLGVLWHRQGRAEEGLRLLQQAVTICPGYASACNNLGNILLGMGRYIEAAEAYRKAAELQPDLPEVHMNLAAVLRRSDRLDEAVASFRRAIELNPQLSQAHLHVGSVLYTLGRIDEAAAAFRAWQQLEPDNPIAAPIAAACSGIDVPERASDAFVRATFDAFAEKFDEKMASLYYGAPSLLAAAVAARCQASRQLRVLDAGCGTGLCGPVLRPYAQHLTGVDLSEPMVQKAREREVYDELVVAELGEFLAARPLAYDLIASGDTLVYFGRLEAVLHDAAQVLLPGGHLVFTLEASDGCTEYPGFTLRPHGRYSHAEPYIRRCLEQAGLTIVDIQRDTLRLELGQPVAGMIVTAWKAPLPQVGEPGSAVSCKQPPHG